MRVVRIQSRICVGGPALHSILLSEGLSYRSGSKYDTTLVSGALEPDEASMEGFAKERGVKIRFIPEMGRAVSPRRDALAVARIVRILRSVQPDIVHTHTAKAGAIGRVAARIARVPIVVHTFHGHVFDGYFSPTKTRVFLEVERRLAAMTDQILAISRSQREDLVERYRIAPAGKVGVIPLGLDLSRFRAVSPRGERIGTLRSQLGLSATAPLAVSVGRLVPIKRLDLMIDAWRLITEERPDAHLVMVGDGECRKELEARAQGCGQIHFVGLRRDLPDVYSDADLLLLSSDNEGTPVAVIEALASGLPVVVTDVGGVRDILRDGMGEVVRAGDISAFAGAIRMQFAKLKPLSDAGRDDVLARFSHHRLLSDIESLYDHLVEKRQGIASPAASEVSPIRAGVRCERTQ